MKKSMLTSSMFLVIALTAHKGFYLLAAGMAALCIAADIYDDHQAKKHGQA